MRTAIKSALALSCVWIAVAAGAGAQEAREEAQAKAAKGPRGDADHVVYSPMRGHELGYQNLTKANLIYHGGPTITTAKVVFIFWGADFCIGGVDRAYATTLQAYRNQLGTTPEYAVITQYSGITAANLAAGTADLFDCNNPPVIVTDAIVQAKVSWYLSFFPFDASTVYEVVIPRASNSSSYNSSGAVVTSCGGTNPQYCAYHGWFGTGTTATKYAIEAYPSCGGCQTAGWTNVENEEHFVVHETREAVTDSIGTAWWETINEADDKCAWAPVPFIGTGGFAYQYEWSNKVSGCVKF
jgi:phage gpG-like protein